MINEAHLYVPRPELLAPFRLFALLGLLAAIAGVFLDPPRVWSNLLLAGIFLTGVGLAAMFFIALQYVTGAGWAVVIRRVAESIADLAPVGSGMVIFTIVLGGRYLYPSFMDAEAGHGTFRELWLQPWFVVLRALGYAAAWFLFVRAIRGHSIAQDRDGDAVHTAMNTRWSAGFLVVFGVTVVLSSIDWIMALEPAWYSTMFGVYHFSGLVCAGLSVLIIAVVILRRVGPLRDLVNEHHLHDLGKLLFAFTTFWMYIWFSQWMLIWYGNIAEETVFYLRRGEGWSGLMAGNVLLNWVLPFLLLLSQRAKKSETMLLRVAAIVLAGHWLDLYLSIMPPLQGLQPRFGGWEVAIALGMVSVIVLTIASRLSRAPLIPAGDPLLAESLHHHG